MPSTCCSGASRSGPSRWTAATRARGHLVRWPRGMRRWLDGYADITLREVGPGDGTPAPRVRHRPGRVRLRAEPIRLVDVEGRPVVIDKWGIMQRPFSSRGEEVTAELGVRTRRGHGDPPRGLRHRGVDGVRHACSAPPGPARRSATTPTPTCSTSARRATPAEINLEVYADPAGVHPTRTRRDAQVGQLRDRPVPGAGRRAARHRRLRLLLRRRGAPRDRDAARADPARGDPAADDMSFEGLELPAPADPARCSRRRTAPAGRCLTRPSATSPTGARSPGSRAGSAT